jgi:hypothetical protein
MVFQFGCLGGSFGTEGHSTYLFLSCSSHHAACSYPVRGDDSCRQNMFDYYGLQIDGYDRCTSLRILQTWILCVPSPLGRSIIIANCFFCLSASHSSIGDPGRRWGRFRVSFPPTHAANALPVLVMQMTSLGMWSATMLESPPQLASPHVATCKSALSGRDGNDAIGKAVSDNARSPPL